MLTSGLIFPPQAENIMFLELDVSPPAVFEMVGGIGGQEEKGMTEDEMAGWHH